jgi:arylsulfatase A
MKTFPRLGLATLLMLPLAALHAAEKPDILLIYADDIGYGDVGCYGATAVKTPNVDRIAKEGLRFTGGYCAASTCTPSRYALITGEYANVAGQHPEMVEKLSRELDQLHAQGRSRP